MYSDKNLMNLKLKTTEKKNFVYDFFSMSHHPLHSFPKNGLWLYDSLRECHTTISIDFTLH